jgi:hypothetical protein
MDAKFFLKRIALFSFLTTLPVFASAAPPSGSAHSAGGGGHAVGGGGHAITGGRGQAVGGGGHAITGGRGQAVGGGGQTVIGGRSSAGMQRNGNTVRRDTVSVTNSRSFRDDPSGHGDWKHGHGHWKHGHGTAWHRDEHHHRHDRVSFGFFPYWYPSGGYYSYGYPDYSYDYYDYDYPDNDYDSGQNGSASIQVLVQESLARRGYYPGQIDGVIGPETRTAIREFQRDNGLPVTGRITPQLLQALRNV